MKVNDHVFHKLVQANGVITDVDETKKACYKVNFFWAKYCDTVHGSWKERPERGTKWQWSDPESLIVLEDVIPINKVTSIGGRSLDRLIRRVCQIDRRKRGDGTDVCIVYGQGNHAIPRDVFCVNRFTIIDKYRQCQIMGEELAPRSTRDRTFDGLGWIIKPNVSMGGRGIRPATTDYAKPGMEYYQEMFDKVREFRVHCFLWGKDPVPLIQEKVIDDKRQLCWNKKQGGSFQYPYQPDLNYGKYNGNLSKANVEIMTQMSIEALKKLRYDFGGIDFGMDATGQFKIFEVNSRMGLRERSLFTYKKVFNELKELDIMDYRNRRWA